MPVRDFSVVIPAGMRTGAANKNADIPLMHPQWVIDTTDLKKIRNYDKTLTFYGFHLHFPATGVSPVCLKPANLSVMAPSPV
jgi:hypothetical protein